MIVTLSLQNLWEGILITFAILKHTEYPKSLKAIVIRFSPGMSRNRPRRAE